MNRNFNSYYKRMGLNIDEKTDFIKSQLNRGNIKTVFDFGCANGVMIETLASQYSNIKFIGYDFESVINKNNGRNLPSNVMYTSVMKKEYFNTQTMVILSSVLHEIFGGSNEPLRKFHDDFYEYMGYCGMFCIRDMYFTGAKFDKNIQHEIVYKLYIDNYEEEMKEDYNSIKWDFFGETLRSYKFKLKFDMPYKNNFISEKIESINKFKTTHRKQVWVRKG